MPPSPSSTRGGGLALLALTIIGCYVYSNLKSKKPKRSSSADELNTNYEQDFYPPLPEPCVTLLNASKLCFLATNSDDEPHLSLMNFTYHRDEEVIILSTRTNTKKYHQLVANRKVAILIHDFPHLEHSSTSSSSGAYGKTCSITLNGTASLHSDRASPRYKKYSDIHLRSNAGYAQFIVGDNIGMVVVKIDKLRISDFNDKVSYWSTGTGMTDKEIS